MSIEERRGEASKGRDVAERRKSCWRVVVSVLRRSEWESRLTAVEQGVAWLIKNRMTRTLVLQQRGVFGA